MAELCDIEVVVTSVIDGELEEEVIDIKLLYGLNATIGRCLGGAGGLL